MSTTMIRLTEKKCKQVFNMRFVTNQVDIHGLGPIIYTLNRD